MNHVETVNPRHLREQFKQWAGRRVNVGLTTQHYLCGTWRALDPHEAKFAIGEREMAVKVSEISSIAEAPPFQAEFFK